MPITTAAFRRARAEPLKVTAVTIAGSAVVLWLMGITLGYWWAAVAAVVFIGGPIAWRDVRTRTIPNQWAVTLAAAGVVLSLSSAVARQHPETLLTSALAAAAAFVGYFAFGLIGWVGFGDAKLAAALALVTSVAIGSSSTLLLPYAIVVGGAQRIISTRSFELRTNQAHGPALVVAALILLSTAPFVR